jgi:hypothetical protein
VKRALRERVTEHVIVAPAAVSDLSCAHVLGLEPRQFRDLVTRVAIPHARVGHRIIARVSDVLAALDRLSTQDPSRVSQPDDLQKRPTRVDPLRGETADELDSVDAILAQLGRRRLRGGRPP